MTCGTTIAYGRGCRCDDCRAANATAARGRLTRRRAKPIPDHVPHGKESTYTNWCCRCDACREAWRVACAVRVEARAVALTDDDPRHGLASTYTNYRCRCPLCRTAHNAASRERYRRKREAAA